MGRRRLLPLHKGVEGVWGGGGIEVLTPQLNRHIALLGCEVAHNGHTLVVGPHEDNGRCAVCFVLALVGIHAAAGWNLVGEVLHRIVL